MIGAMIYSFETERCYNTNFDGLVTFPWFHRTLDSGSVSCKGVSSYMIRCLEIVIWTACIIIGQV